MPASPALAPVLSHLRAEPSRTWSIVVTIYGDAVVPRGGSLWLGTLLLFFEALEIGGNVVRTAMSRLAADGLLERTRIGRNSFYRLADRGRTTFAEATRRIYGPHHTPWDGAFRLAVLAEGAEREAARSALERAGFAGLAPGVLVSVGADAAPGGPGTPILLRATAAAEDARRLAGQVWPGERIADRYRRFLIAFSPLASRLDAGEGMSDLDALVARVTLIHEYRRVVLRDPLLPEALLPDDWPGHAARDLCGQLYHALLPASERWLDQNGLGEHGRLPPPDAGLYLRFASS